MNRILRHIFGALLLSAMGISTSFSQVVAPTPFFTSFFDSTSTYNGQPLVVGTIIESYDVDGVLNGRDTVTIAGVYGFMPVYGDDNNSGVDEGALEGELIRFTVNGRDATVVAGDAIWSNQAIKLASLSASGTIAMSGVDLPLSIASLPDDSIQFRVRVRNDGDGLDYYGVNLSMSIPDDNTIFGWKALEPDSFVYAASGAEADVFFTIRTARYSPDTVNTITYSVFSHLDNSVTVDGTVDIIMTLTDVDDDPSTNLPNQFAVDQNYPNPFNPTTTIAFQLPAGSEVQFQVFDLLGRAVEELNLGFLPAGSHEHVFDASHLASGLYFYRITSAFGSASRKMILLK